MKTYTCITAKDSNYNPGVASGIAQWKTATRIQARPGRNFSLQCSTAIWCTSENSDECDWSV